MRAGHYPEHRAENKGAEPEGIEVAGFGDGTLVLVNAERGNFVAVYEDQGEAGLSHLQLPPTAIGPEGAVAVPDRGLLIVASEADSEEDGFRGALGIYARTADTLPYPTVVSAVDAAGGAPLGWGDWRPIRPMQTCSMPSATAPTRCPASTPSTSRRCRRPSTPPSTC